MRRRDMRFACIATNRDNTCAVRHMANHAGGVLRGTVPVSRSSDRSNQQSGEAEQSEYAIRSRPFCRAGGHF